MSQISHGLVKIASKKWKHFLKNLDVYRFNKGDNECRVFMGYG